MRGTTSHGRHAQACPAYPRLPSLCDKAWMAGTRPAMTIKTRIEGPICNLRTFPRPSRVMPGGEGEAARKGQRMPPMIGYLLPTRERVMEGRPETASLLDLAARAENLGFDSVWVGD